MTGWIWHDEPTLPMGTPANNELEYLVHLAAREWSISPPILIRGPDDLESRKHWRETLTPYKHQVQNLITFCRRAPVALIADDVGLGKTISAGLIVSELVTRKKVRRVLIVCPSLLLEQWAKELNDKFSLDAEFATGSKFDELARSKTSIVVTTYDTIRARLDSIKPGQFDLLVLDEAHKLRNLHGNKQPPQIASAIRSKLASKAFKYVVMLTATPIQNRLWDLYSLVDILAAAKGHANPLGSTQEFDFHYIADRTGSGRRLNAGNAERFRRILSQYMVRTRRSDCRLPFPVRQVKKLQLQPTQEELHLIASLQEYIQHLNALQQTSIFQATCSSPQALLAQLENMRQTDFASRQVVRECAMRVRRTSKMRGLISILRDLASAEPNSWRAVIFTLRKETQYAIEKELVIEFGAESVGLIQGGKAEDNRRTIRRFGEQSPRMHVIVSTDAGAEGVNLQMANVVVNFDLPWNPMVVEQRIGRVQRLGSTAEYVVVINLVLANTFEENVVLRLSEKLQVVAHSIGDIESVLESIGGGDNGESFETTIRTLVLNSLKGQDTNAAIAAKNRSIEEAKLLYQESEKTVEETVGALDAMHNAGSRPPELTPVQRSMHHPEFVEKALRAGGAKLTPIPNGFVVKHPGSSDERIYFREEDQEPTTSGYFGAPRSNVYTPGEPHFERLVGQWKNGPDTWVCRAVNDGDEALDAAVRAWLAQFEGSSLDSWAITNTKDHFGGRLELQAEAQVAHDRYETIFPAETKTTATGNQGPLPEPNPAQPDGKFTLAKLMPDAQQFLKRAAEANMNIRAFCEFYIGRRTEELAKADTAGAVHIQRSYTPGLAVQLIGVRGVTFRQVSVAVHYKIAGESGTADLELVPSTGAILLQPELQTCSVSGRRAPVGYFEQCAVSQRLVLKSLLETCAATGLRALPEHMGSCEATGARVLASHLGLSAVSGKRVRLNLLIPSAISGRLGLEEELVRCAFTGAHLAQDEAVRSDASGKLARFDQLVTSAVSGRVGHASEFIPCAVTGDMLLPEEAEVSDLSGRRVRPDQLLTSALPPHRRGTEDEMAECCISGQRLLRDETGTSKVSSRVAGLAHMDRSEVSGSWALRDELLTCEVSGKRLLPEESAKSAVSGKVVDWNLLESCRYTGNLVLPDELEVSSASGHRVRKDLLVPSDKPPHGRALPTELVVCESTGMRLLPEETEASALSGKYFDRDLLRPSDQSGRRGLIEEGATCEVSGRWLLFDELERSAVSGKQVGLDLMSACAHTGARCLPDELEPSAVSGKPVRRDLLVPSDKPPHSLALAEELVTCAITGKHLLPSEMETSVVSRARADRDLMVRSAKSQAWALPSETGMCQESGRTLLQAELGTCQATGRQAGFDLLGQSAVSGRRVIASLLVACPETEQLALPSELELCAKTGQQVVPAVLATSAATGRKALRRLLVVSAVSGKLLLPDEGERSAKSASLALRDELVACSWNGRLYLPSETGTCALTGVVLAAETLGPDGAGLQLRRVLDGTGGTPKPPTELIDHLRALDPKVLGELRDIQVLGSPDEKALVFCGAHRTLFGLKTRWIGGYFRRTPAPEVLGTIVSGTRKDGKWLAS
jgi:superfamily II DNA or RNA helicase